MTETMERVCCGPVKAYIIYQPKSRLLLSGFANGKPQWSKEAALLSDDSYEMLFIFYGWSRKTHRVAGLTLELE